MGVSAKKAGVVLAVGSVVSMLGRLLYCLMMLFGQRISAGYWDSRIRQDGGSVVDGGCGEWDDGFHDDYDGGFNIAWLCFTGLVVLVYAK